MSRTSWTILAERQLMLGEAAADVHMLRCAPRAESMAADASRICKKFQQVVGSDVSR